MDDHEENPEWDGRDPGAHELMTRARALLDNLPLEGGVKLLYENAHRFQSYDAFRLYMLAVMLLGGDRTAREIAQFCGLPESVAITALTPWLGGELIEPRVKKQPSGDDAN